MMFLHDVVGGPMLAIDPVAYLLGLMTLPTLGFVLAMIAYWRQRNVMPPILGDDGEHDE